MIFSRNNLQNSTFKKQATWEDAQKACRAIGADLLAVEFADKDRCVTKLATG
jgi:hypothetical protein